jgi:hypothetical protein
MQLTCFAGVEAKAKALEIVLVAGVLSRAYVRMQLDKLKDAFWPESPAAAPVTQVSGATGTAHSHSTLTCAAVTHCPSANGMKLPAQVLTADAIKCFSEEDCPTNMACRPTKKNFCSFGTELGGS